MTVLDSFSFQQTPLLDCCARPEFEVVRGDCRDRATLQKAMATADWLLPLAAVVGAPACQADAVAARSINVDAVRLLLKLRSPHQRIVFPNTNSGYGVGEPDKLCTEESPMRPLSLYGVTKVEAEHAVLDSPNAVAFRLATAFGMSPRMRVDLLVNDFVYRAVNDRAMVLFEGHARRNFIHVRDVARAFLHAMAHFQAMQGEPYNLGLSDANLSKRELCAEIRKQLPEFVYFEAPIGEDPDRRDYLISNAKIERTGYRTTFSLEMGIRELIKGYRFLRNRRHGNAG